ncbi:MAG: branched-chain amino acid ABC transporter substrate-binding protein [Actinomycetota bacterium]
MPSVEPLEKPCKWQIGVVGALGGEFGAVGRPIAQGVELAVARINAEPQVPCLIQIHERDSRGRPQRAIRMVRDLLRSKDLVACVCGFFSGETQAVGAMVARRGIPFSGTGPSPLLRAGGFDTWFRAVASDDIQGYVAGRYMARVLKAERIGIVYVEDGYGRDVARGVVEGVGEKDLLSIGIAPEIPEIKKAVRTIRRFDPDAVYFAGLLEESARFARELHRADVNAQFITSDGAKDPEFGQLAGPGADKALASCSCSDPEALTDPVFYDLYTDEYGEVPGIFTAEIYDVVSFFGAALARASPHDPIRRLRASVVDYLSRGKGLEGVAKTYTWDPRGELKADPAHVWMYVWDDSEADFVGIGTVASLMDVTVQ